jgi:hypothetical protein
MANVAPADGCGDASQSGPAVLAGHDQGRCRAHRGGVPSTCHDQAVTEGAPDPVDLATGKLLGASRSGGQAWSERWSGWSWSCHGREPKQGSGAGEVAQTRPARSCKCLRRRRWPGVCRRGAHVPKRPRVPPITDDVAASIVRDAKKCQPEEGLERA